MIKMPKISEAQWSNLIDFCGIFQNYLRVRDTLKKVLSQARVIKYTTWYYRLAL